MSRFTRCHTSSRALTVALTVAAVALPLSATSAHAAPGAEVAPNSQLTASVTDDATSPDGCTLSSTTLTARRQHGSQNLEVVEYLRSSTNTCTGEYHEVYGDAKPTKLTFAGTERAEVVAMIALKDQAGDPAGTLEVDETWVATGPPERGKFRENTVDSDGVRHIFFNIWVYRAADATGTVTGSNAYIERDVVFEANIGR